MGEPPKKGKMQFTRKTKNKRLPNGATKTLPFSLLSLGPLPFFNKTAEPLKLSLLPSLCQFWTLLSFLPTPKFLPDPSFFSLPRNSFGLLLFQTLKTSYFSLLFLFSLPANPFLLLSKGPL